MGVSDSNDDNSVGDTTKDLAEVWEMSKDTTSESSLDIIGVDACGVEDNWYEKSEMEDTLSCAAFDESPSECPATLTDEDASDEVVGTDAWLNAGAICSEKELVRVTTGKLVVAGIYVWVLEEGVVERGRDSLLETDWERDVSTAEVDGIDKMSELENMSRVERIPVVDVWRLDTVKGDNELDEEAVTASTLLVWFCKNKLSMISLNEPQITIKVFL